MTRNLRLLALTVLAVLAAVPATARAAAPGVSTGGAARVTQTSATLTGAVNPRGEPTVYFFQLGPTTAYGARTPDFPAGSGTTAVTAAADIAGLQPNTRYHYRLVARNRSGTSRGADRVFRTPAQPLGVTLSADVNPITWGNPTAIRGAITGTGGAGQPVVLQARNFPFTTGFRDIVGPITTDGAGGFLFAPIGLGATTQYRVRLVNRPGVASPIVTVGVGVRIATYVKRTVRRNSLLTFSGTIRPARPGAQVGIQKRNSRGGWSIVGGTITRGGSSTSSSFRKAVRVPRGGTYRVLVALADGNLTSNTGTEVQIRTFR